MNVPTLILTPLLAFALVLALLAAVRMMRGWSRGAAAGAERHVDADPERLVLEDKKERVLTTLADLEQEYEMGKLGEQDYNDLRRFYQTEAVRILERLDQL